MNDGLVVCNDRRKLKYKDLGGRKLIDSDLYYTCYRKCTPKFFNIWLKNYDYISDHISLKVKADFALRTRVVRLRECAELDSSQL